MTERDDKMTANTIHGEQPVGNKQIEYAALPSGVIMRGREMIARCRSRAMAQRIAWLLNKYGGSKHGKGEQHEE